ncbi:hypothetical protein ACFFX1_14420 [Dactylosporangium sucinum]|uniref:Uncharacterized protein n=1 Tax=Dactylosporangium sucinum TaxID=1424081 RepID=A0A917UBP1_9ACTN|nr:hypothetical protein [Dactylosporangium sucinum]GGM69810.1 hypothetical protein GCM10007977_084450 [Dactylosporangium sucinum]
MTIEYCLGDADCEPAELVLPSTWTVQDARAVATSFQRTVLPWDLTPLRAVHGRRVILAAPVSLAGDLQQTLAAAGKAADIADRFARWGAPPKRYVVYFAGPEQWSTWWNGDGIALLAVTCLAKRFGEDRMLAFFTAVVREQSAPETAAPTAFGTQWAPIAAACAAEVRARAR